MNLFDDIPKTLPDELFTDLLVHSNVRIERIVSKGHASAPDAWYDQDDGEWVIVLQGAARLEIADKGEVSLGVGDHIFLPAHCRHRVAWTDPDETTIWLAVFIGAES